MCPICVRCEWTCLCRPKAPLAVPLWLFGLFLSLVLYDLGQTTFPTAALYLILISLIHSNYLRGQSGAHILGPWLLWYWWQYHQPDAETGNGCAIVLCNVFYTKLWSLLCQFMEHSAATACVLFTHKTGKQWDNNNKLIGNMIIHHVENSPYTFSLLMPGGSSWCGIWI